MPSQHELMRAPGQILIVDDEDNIRRGLRAVLTKDGHIVEDVPDGAAALVILESFPREVAIIDIRMPGMSGVELLHEIRARWPNVAVIMLTGHGTLDSAMEAIKQGAQDYLLKPASPDAIREAVNKALLEVRRQREQALLLSSLRYGLERLGQIPGSSPASDSEGRRQQIHLGELVIDPQSHQVWRSEKPISLTPSEFQLLLTLAGRPGQVVAYVALVKLALDYTAEPWEAKELIKRHVFSLRSKIEEVPSSPKYILNVRGVGYRLASERDLAFPV